MSLPMYASDSQIVTVLLSAATLIVSLWNRAMVAELQQKVIEREEALRKEIRREFVPRELCKEIDHHVVNAGSD
jgi:hypothetical protein